MRCDCTGDQFLRTKDLCTLELNGCMSPFVKWGGGTPFPANTRCWNSVVSMLGHRLRRWPNIETTLFQRLVFAGLSFQDDMMWVDRRLNRWFCQVQQRFSVSGISSSNSLPCSRTSRRHLVCMARQWLWLSGTWAWSSLSVQYKTRGNTLRMMAIIPTSLLPCPTCVTTAGLACLRFHLPRQLLSSAQFLSPASRGRKILVAPGFCLASGVTFSCGRKNSKTTGQFFSKF